MLAVLALTCSSTHIKYDGIQALCYHISMLYGCSLTISVRFLELIPQKVISLMVAGTLQTEFLANRTSEEYFSEILVAVLYSEL